MKEAQRHSLSWHRSNACADSTCVEVAGHGKQIYLRDGKKPDDAVLHFTRAEWEAFLAAAKAGDFDSV